MADPIVAEPVTAETTEAVPEQPFVLGTEPMFTPPTDVVEPDPEVPAEPTPADQTHEEWLAALSDEERENLAPIQSLVARKSESVRRTTERKVAADAYTATQTYAGSEAVIADLTEIAREAAFNTDDNGKPIIAPEKIGKATNAVLARGVAVGVNMLSRYLEEQAPESFTLSKPEQDGIEAAQVLYHQNPLDPTPLFRAWLTPFQRAAQAGLETELTERLRPQIRKEEQERIRAEAAAKAGEERASAPTATSLNGASPSMGRPAKDMTSYIGISAALRNGLASEDEAAKAYAALS